MAEQKQSFEKAMSRLEEIVSLLERGDRPLEESMALFEEGTKLMKQCASQLDKAEQKVVKLTGMESGTPKEVPFAEMGSE